MDTLRATHRSLPQELQEQAFAVAGGVRGDSCHFLSCCQGPESPPKAPQEHPCCGLGCQPGFPSSILPAQLLNGFLPPSLWRALQPDLLPVLSPTQLLPFILSPVSLITYPHGPIHCFLTSWLVALHGLPYKFTAQHPVSSRLLSPSLHAAPFSLAQGGSLPFPNPLSFLILLT